MINLATFERFPVLHFGASEQIAFLFIIKYIIEVDRSDGNQQIVSNELILQYILAFLF